MSTLDALPNITRTDQDDFGEIFRRNMPYGTVSDHGTVFVGFASAQAMLHQMIENMAGLRGPRDAITHYTATLTGAYYFVPPVAAIRSLASAEALESP